MRLVLTFISILSVLAFQKMDAQSETQVLSEMDSIHNIERLILEREVDSAKVLLNNLAVSTDNENHFKLLKDIVDGNASYKKYFQFIYKVGEQPKVDYEKISDYIKEEVEEPISLNEIDLDYVYLKWWYIAKLRDEVTIEEATTEQEILDIYIGHFELAKIDVQKAQILSDTHQFVLDQIRRELDASKQKSLDNINLSKELGDKKLEAISLYHYSDFLVFEPNSVGEYAQLCETILNIEEEFEIDNPYHLATQVNLINAYIFKGGHDARVIELLSKMYEDPQTRVQSYSLYAQYLGDSETNANNKEEILKKFKVANIKEFAKKTSELGKPDLNPNDYFYVLNENSWALFRNGEPKEAMRYKDKAIALTQEIYSRDLAKSLASAEAREEVKAKEVELKLQKQQTSFYIFLTLLGILLFIVALLASRKFRKQAKELNAQNKLINKSLKEKELLIKEVHHRVKNNFQIISSLLDLQTKEVEDEKALEMAQEGKNRVKSMSLIHEKLYQNDDLLIEIDDYVSKLIKDIGSIYGSDISPGVALNLGSYRFDIDTAIPLGLIINEIITNAYKYGFNKLNPQLEINLTKRSKGIFILTIKDNGKGLPGNFDFEKTKTLGLRLVRRLSSQLHGRTSYSFDNGAMFQIEFKETVEREKIA